MSNEGEFVIKECLIYGVESLPENLKERLVFKIFNGTYESCRFENINKCIANVKQVTDCEFYNCKDVISSEMFGVFGIKDKKITNCIFEACEDVIAAENTQISNCQFIRCKNNIIDVQSDGNVVIEFCEFYNIRCEGENISSRSCLIFSRNKDKTSSHSTLRKCVFDGIDAGNDFLIQGHVYEKISGPTAYIEDCSFKNCVTKRKSGKIISEYGRYFGLFNRLIEVKTISIRDCQGLDKINQENGYTEDVIVKAGTLKGVKISDIVEDVKLLSPMWVAGDITRKIIRDTDKHEE